MTPGALLLTAAAVFIAWAAYASPAIVSLSQNALEACQSLLVRCLELAAIAKLFLIWSGAALLISGLSYASFRALRNISRAREAISRLPLKHSGTVALISDERLKSAFTGGYLKPRIYISTGLLKSLDRDELRAVFLHELRHKRSYDPLRFLIYGFVKDLFYYIPAVKYLAIVARLRKEHAADDAASRGLGGPLFVASALIKVARQNVTYGAAAMAGEKDEVAGRIRRLVEGQEHRIKVPLRAALLSLLFASALVMSLSMPIFAGGGHECTLEKCELHVDKVEGCRTHCEKHSYTH